MKVIHLWDCSMLSTVASNQFPDTTRAISEYSLDSIKHIFILMHGYRYAD